MTIDGGFNPMRWDCDKRGCFNKKRRPKIEVFSDCFPGRISFGDIDGIVEISGNALLLEWKSVEGELPMGQRILYQQLTRGGLVTAMIVVGDAETMETTSMAVFARGTRHPKIGWDSADLAIVKARIADWARFAAQNPAKLLDKI